MSADPNYCATDAQVDEIALLMDQMGSMLRVEHPVVRALTNRIGEDRRRMDAVRGYAQTAVDLGRAIGDPSMERVGADVLRLLDGDGEAGDE